MTLEEYLIDIYFNIINQQNGETMYLKNKLNFTSISTGLNKINSKKNIDNKTHVNIMSLSYFICLVKSKQKVKKHCKAKETDGNEFGITIIKNENIINI
jgi:hypothetical protein